jgi:GDP-D-mannose dehydratase
MIDEHLMRPSGILGNRVDPSRTANDLGWKARDGMIQVVSMMLEAEVESLRHEKVC